MLEGPFENFFSDTPTIVSPLAPKIERNGTEIAGGREKIV